MISRQRVEKSESSSGNIQIPVNMLGHDDCRIDDERAFGYDVAERLAEDVGIGIWLGICLVFSGLSIDR